MKKFKTKVTGLLVFFFITYSASLLAQVVNPQCQCSIGACTGSIANIDYSGTGGWASVLSTPNSMNISNGVMNYVSTPGGNYNRMVTGLPSLTAQSQNFIAECKITITGGTSPGHYIMAITSTNDDPVSTNATGYPLINNDALAVILNKEGPGPTGTCCTNPCTPNQRWLFQILYKDSVFAPVINTNNVIPVSGCTFPLTYYVRLVRSTCWVYLGVYSDAAFSNHITGSPICMSMPTTITGFRRLQHGVITWSSPYRTLNMKLDDTRVCPYVSGCNVPGCPSPNPVFDDNAAGKEILLGAADKENNISINPNPSSGMFKLNVSKADEEITSIAIYDLTGKIYKLIDKVENADAIFINGNDLKNGMYMVEAYGKSKSWKSKIVIQR